MLRVSDIEEHIIEASQAGNASTGKKTLWRAPFDGIVIYVAMRVGTAGTTGSQIADCNINGASIYATAGNRPTLTTGTDVTTEGGTVIDGTRTFTKGDLLDLSLDSVHTTPAVDTAIFAVVRQRPTVNRAEYAL